MMATTARLPNMTDFWFMSDVNEQRAKR
jgi:hypothetical protein